jgi:hypothetical protein
MTQSATRIDPPKVNHQADIQNIFGSERIIHGKEISPLQIMLQVRLFVQPISILKFVKIDVKN